MNKLREMLEKHEKIVCLLTMYEKNIGNCTKVVFRGGAEIQLNQSVESVLRNITKYYSIDINELKRKQQKLLGTQYCTPLPISKDLLFICIKTRIPRIKKDPCTSYINFYEIDKLDKNLPILHMKNGQKIESLNKIKTLSKRYNQGEICARLQNDEYKHSSIIAEDSVSYLYPATKGDIRSIAKDIEELRELLKGILSSSKK